MDFTKYENKLPYGPYGSPERLAHQMEGAKLSVLFQIDAIREAGLEGHPLADALFGFAYAHGHASGYHEVFGLLYDLSERLVSRGAPAPPVVARVPVRKDGRFIFRDRHNKLCALQMSPLPEDGDLRLGLSAQRMCLSRETVAGLIPLLQHYVNMGKLPD